MSKRKASPADNGGSIALLNLPAFSVLSMNASASQTLKNEEQLLVISDVQPPNGCHLLVVRGGGKIGSPDSHNGATLHSIGILILYPSNDESWFVARKFDAQTEEISSQLLDEISFKNLRRSVEQRENMNVSRIIPQERLFNSNMARSQSSNDIWSRFLTHYISRDVLSMHGLTGRGDKIVPGTFSHEEDSLNKNNNDQSHMSESNGEEEDGHSLKYPPIPHVDPSQSHKINAHSGTKSFLSALSPAERTEIFLSINDSCVDIMFDKVLARYYNGDWKLLLGQLQLSFIIFLCCSCLSSLEHWRDTLQMLSLATPKTIMSNSDLFEQLLTVIQYQLFGLNNDLFDDQDILDGNCLIPAIKRLCLQCKDQSYNFILKSLAIEILKQLQKHVPDIDISGDDEQNINELNHLALNQEGDDEDDEDGPVVVSIDEVTASLERSSNTKSYDKSIYASKYPFLFASMVDNEDILMTCSRILDEKPDVTSVREAAAYLEEVESFSAKC